MTRNTKHTRELTAYYRRSFASQVHQRRRELVRAAHLWAKQRAIVARMEALRKARAA